MAFMTTKDHVRAAVNRLMVDEKISAAEAQARVQVACRTVVADTTANRDAAAERGLGWMFADPDEDPDAQTAAVERLMKEPPRRHSRPRLRVVRDESGQRACPLSPREMEILGCIADAMTRAQIAQRLQVSVNTVRNHFSAIYDTLDLDRAEAIAWYQQHRLQEVSNG